MLRYLSADIISSEKPSGEASFLAYCKLRGPDNVQGKIPELKSFSQIEAIALIILQIFLAVGI